MGKEIKLEISVSEDIGEQVKIVVRHIYDGELKVLSQSFINDGGDDVERRAQFVVDYATVQASLLMQKSMDSVVEELIEKRRSAKECKP